MNNKKHISLDKLDKKTPFSIPDNYFEDFPEVMTKKIKEKEHTKHRTLRRWTYSIAASIIGIIMLTQVSILNSNKENSTTNDYDNYVLSQVDENVIYDYYIENYDKQ